jgi:hypothetical protein
VLFPLRSVLYILEVGKVFMPFGKILLLPEEMPIEWQVVAHRRAVIPKHQPSVMVWRI